MKAAVIYGTRDLRVEEREIRKVEANQAKVEVAWAGICGSDLHVYTHFDLGLIPTEELHPLSGQKAPLTLGHEFSGIVVEIGEDVTNVSIGDRVAIEPIYYCNECIECKSGNYNVCRKSNAAFVGLASDGGFAEYCVLESDKLHILPEEVSLEEGALVEPAAVAYHGLLESGFQAGQTALVIGAGPIGLLAVANLVAAGATKIFVSDVSDERLAIAKKMGASKVINPMKDDVVLEVYNETNNDGVDVVFECAGVQAAIDTALTAVKRKGCVLVLSLFMEPVNVSLLEAVMKEVTIKSTLAYVNEYPQVLDLIASKRLNVLDVVTNKAKLDNIVEDGFEKLLSDKSEAKILINMK